MVSRMRAASLPTHFFVHLVAAALLGLQHDVHQLFGLGLVQLGRVGSAMPGWISPVTPGRLTGWAGCAEGTAIATGCAAAAEPWAARQGAALLQPVQ